MSIVACYRLFKNVCFACFGSAFAGNCKRAFQVQLDANRAYGRVGLPFRQAKRIKIRKKIQNLTLFQDYFLVFLRHSIPYI